MEKYFELKYYQEIFVGLVFVVIALIYFIGNIIDKIKFNKKFKKKKRG